MRENTDADTKIYLFHTWKLFLFLFMFLLILVISWYQKVRSQVGVGVVVIEVVLSFCQFSVFISIIYLFYYSKLTYNLLALARSLCCSCSSLVVTLYLIVGSSVLLLLCHDFLSVLFTTFEMSNLLLHLLLCLYYSVG